MARKQRKIKVNPGYDPKTVIEVRSYGIKDLTRYKEKIKKNIKIFEEAIEKERKELKRVEGMIEVLKKDIQEAKSFL